MKSADELVIAVTAVHAKVYSCLALSVVLTSERAEGLLQKIMNRIMWPAA